MKRLSIFFAALMACTLSFAETATTKLSNADIVKVFDDSNKGYRDITLTDANGFVYKANAICNQHSNATSENKYLQIKKGSGYIQIPEMPGVIQTIVMTVSNANSAMTGGGNTANVSFVTTNNDAKTALATATDASSITLDLSANTTVKEGYINASGAVRIWDMEITYNTASSETPVAVESVALDQTELSLEAGKTATLVATITPANATNKEVTWATDNDKVAIVADGVVTAVAEGTANITVTTADGAKTATCAVTVTAVKPIDGMNYVVDFTIDQQNWTIVDKNLPSGLSYVWSYASSYKCMKASAYASKTNYQAESWLVSPVLDLSEAETATLTINHARNQFGSNDQISLKATTNGTDWTDLTVSQWPKGDASYTFVEGQADLKSVLSATTQIAIVYNNTTKNATTYEVKTIAIKGGKTVHATSVALDPTALEIEQYKSATITATLTPAEATDLVEWASDNEKVATVSATGVVTAVGLGTANITATANSVSATCAVTVKAATPITCAEAVELAKAVSGNNVAAEGGMYVIHGYVTALVGTPASDMGTHGNYSVWMADTKDGGKVFEAYQVKPVDGETIAAVGDFVEVVGDITKYYDTYETMGKGTATINILIPAPKVYTISAEYDDTKGTVACGEETAFVIGEYEENTEITLTATPKEGYKFMNWTVKVGEDDNTETANPLTVTVTADMEITANFVKDASTAVDNTDADGVVVEKVVRDGQVLIIRDGKTYNVIGKMVD